MPFIEKLVIHQSLHQGRIQDLGFGGGGLGLDISQHVQQHHYMTILIKHVSFCCFKTKETCFYLKIVLKQAQISRKSPLP